MTIKKKINNRITTTRSATSVPPIAVQNKVGKKHTKNMSNRGKKKQKKKSTCTMKNEKYVYNEK